MNKFLFIALHLVLLEYVNAQDVFINNGQDIVFNEGVEFIVKDGNMINDAGLIENKGLVVVEGDYVNNTITNGGNSNSEFKIKNNWENNATFNANGSTVALNGTNQKITGIEETTFNNLNFENGSVKTLETNTFVNGTLQINDSELATDAYKMTILNPSLNALQFNENVGFVSSSFNGRLVRNTNSMLPYVFPTGKNIGTLKYRPIMISPNTNRNNQFEVSFVNSNADSDGYSFDLRAQNINSINSNFYHFVNQSIGNNDAQISLFYDKNTDGEWGGIAQWESKWRSIGETSSNNSSILTEIKYNKWISNNYEPHVLVNLEECKIALPTGFSPDGNNTNETFKVMKSCDLNSFEMKVFDRWGSLIFTSTDINKPWDGTYKDYNVEMGVYTWVIDYTLEGSTESKQEKGSITLIK